MTFANLRLAVSAAMLALAWPAVAHADADDVPNGKLHGKIEYCTYCHGSSGQGYRAYYTMPRIAGQTPEYFVNQLKAYAERRRRNVFMYPIAHSLSPSMRQALARHFARLNPPPYGHGSRELAAEGRRIYQEGLPNSNVPACAACHGFEGQGSGQNPRLAGQLKGYTQKTLANWRKERSHDEVSDPSSIMLSISGNLSKTQMAAVAAYLSSLK